MPLFNLNPKEIPRELFSSEKELDELVHLVKARRWIAILGPRMVGKTSLTKAANVKLEKMGVKATDVATSLRLLRHYLQYCRRVSSSTREASPQGYSHCISFYNSPPIL